MVVTIRKISRLRYNQIFSSNVGIILGYDRIAKGSDIDKNTQKKMYPHPSSVEVIVYILFKVYNNIRINEWG